jgi:hypothetical protein
MITHAPSGKKNTPHLAISFAESEYPLVLNLKYLIGGSIRHKVENHAYVLTITSISGLINIINLMNGCMRTPKIARFNAMIDWINQSTGSSIPTYSVDNSNLLNNAWLAGFIEADGSFDIRVSQTSGGSSKNRVSARLRLEQRKVDPSTGVSYLNIMTSIATTLGVSLNISKHHLCPPYLQPKPSSSSVRERDVQLQTKQGKGDSALAGDKGGSVEYFQVSASSTKSRIVIVNYFTRFPLFSSKRLNYLD